MAEGIPGPPNEYTVGLEFDYSVWTAGTRIDIVNVPWNNDYRDVVKFDNKNQLDAYIDGLSSAGVTINNLTYAKPGEDIYLQFPVNRINRYNYLRASNPLMPIPGDVQKNYYYFILDAEMINPGNVRLRLQLDIWQTYVYDVTFGQCFVERGHVGIANMNNFINYGRDYLTIPEGLDIGSDYQVIARKSETLIRNAMVASPDILNGDVIVATTVDWEASGGTEDDPVLVSATGSQINGIPSGANFYIFSSMYTFRNFLISKAEQPWVTQGIISATIMPSISRYTLGGAPAIDGEKVDQLIMTPRRYNWFVNWRDSAEINNAIGQRYRFLNKFKTFPYMVIEITAFSGNAIVLKPEAWNNPDAAVIERASYLPPNQRISLIPSKYNAINGAPSDNLWDFTDERLNDFPEVLANTFRDAGDDGGDWADIAVSINNFPSVPVVNNMALSVLASNANQLAYQFRSADWAQTRALAGAQAGYDVATGAIHTAQSLAGITGNADIAQTALNNRLQAAQAIMNASGDVASGIMMGPAGIGLGVAKAAVGGMNTAFQLQANDEGLAIRQQQLAGSTIQSGEQARLSRDTNVDLARFSAKGDYANQIDGVNAKIQDIAMTQPSVSGQFGGESHNIATNKLEFSLRIKFIDDAATRRIGEIWLRYGYRIGAFMQLPQSLKVMTKFTYWKLLETYIASSMVPESHKQVLRGILEKGVTVWNNPNDIGQIDIGTNEPVVGAYY